MKIMLLAFMIGHLFFCPISLNATGAGDLVLGLFRLLDSDDSGHLSKAEWQQFRDTLVVDEQGVVHEAALSATLRRLGGSDLNLNLNEALSSESVSHPFDVDEDGLLELEDLDQIFIKFDRNLDRQIDVGEMPAKPVAPRHPPR